MLMVHALLNIDSASGLDDPKGLPVTAFSNLIPLFILERIASGMRSVVAHGLFGLDKGDCVAPSV